MMHNLLPYLLLIIVPMLLGLWAQAKISLAFRRWGKVQSRSGLTGADVARRILAAAGIRDVEVVPIAGSLTDHYDPRTKQVALSEPVYSQGSIAALGIAAHEVGHAIQHARRYTPMYLRSAIVPVTTFASRLLPILIMAGIFLPMLLGLGGALTVQIILVIVACYAVLAIFQLVTLPVELNASHRAKVILSEMGITPQDEAVGVRQMLNAAALTYVAAFVVTLGQLLYWVFILLGRRR